MKPRAAHLPLRPGLVPALARALTGAPSRLRGWLNSIGYMGAYATTDPSRTILGDWHPRNSTSDQTLTWNLTNLIAQLRWLSRNNCSVRGLIAGWKADVVGTGIDIEPDTGDDKLNARIREEWLHWTESVTPDGKSLWEMQRQAMDEWCCAGAHFWREITIADRAKPDSNGIVRLPVCFTAVETEWLTLMPIGTISENESFTRGIQCDTYGRPTAYHIMDYNLLNQQGMAVAWGGPGDVVPAGKVIHGFEQTRARQVHGEPLLVAIIERCFQDGALVDTELKAARSTAAQAGVITLLDQQEWTSTQSVVDQYGNVTNQKVSVPVMDSPIANWTKLAPGEKAEAFNNTRPSQQIMPFRQGLRGDLAAGSYSTQQWLDRDSSRANYSNMRSDDQFTQRVRGPVQQVFGRSVASMPYEKVLPWILLKLGVALPKNPDARRLMFRHKMVFDRPPYVDPAKDSAASDFMVKNGLSTLEEELGNRGRDYRKVREQRAKEIANADTDAIDRIVGIQAQLKKRGVEGVDWSQIAAIGGANSAPGAFLDGVASANGDDGDDSAAPAASGKSGKGAADA